MFIESFIYRQSLLFWVASMLQEIFYLFIFLSLPFIPLIPSPLGNHYSVVCIHKSFSFSAQSLHPITHPVAELSSCSLSDILKWIFTDWWRERLLLLGFFSVSNNYKINLKIFFLFISFPHWCHPDRIVGKTPFLTLGTWITVMERLPPRCS